MYLLEAKKRAEKEHAKAVKAEKQAAAKAAREEHRAQLKAAKKNKGASSAASASSGGRGRSKLAAEAAEALAKAEAEQRRAAEERQIQEAIRRSQEDQQRLMKQHQQQPPQQRRSPQQQRQSPLAARRKITSSGGGDLVVKPLAAGGGVQKTAAPSPNEPFGWKDVQVNTKYIGTFEVEAGSDRTSVKHGIRSMREYTGTGRPATLIICLEGIKVVDHATSKIAMAHALGRITMSSGDPKLGLFGFVAKNAGVKDKFCHVFSMKEPRHVQEFQMLVGRAFKIAFSKDRTMKHHKVESRGQPAAAASTAPPPAAQAAPKPKAAPAAAQAQARPTQTRPSRGNAGPPPAAISRAQPGRRSWAKHNPLQGLRSDRATAAAPPVVGSPLMERAAPASRPSAPPQPAQAPVARKLAHEVVEEGTLDTMPSAPPASAVQGAAAVDDIDGAPTDVVGIDAALEAVAWYQAGIPREIATELLEMSSDGAFIVRNSQSKPGNYALTMRGNGVMHHYLIAKTATGYCINEQEARDYSSLIELIIGYSCDKGILPCELEMDEVNKLAVDGDKDDEDDDGTFIDPDYQELKLKREKKGDA